MPKIEFSAIPNNQEVVDAEVVESKFMNDDNPPVETTSIADAPPAVSPGVPSVYKPRQTFSDDDNIDFSDIILPSLNLVQRVGPLSVVFNPGEIVLDKTLVLPRPLKFLVIGMGPIRYVERLKSEERDSGAESRMVETEQEVAAIGGTTDYKVHETTKRPWFQPLRTAMILIEKPEGVEPGLHFTLRLDGKLHCMAFWSMKATAYTHAAKPLRTQRKFGLMAGGGYLTQWWSLNTKSQSFKGGKNVAVIPELGHVGPTTQNIIKGIRALLYGEVYTSTTEPASQV